jgi:hypothetical protein
MFVWFVEGRAIYAVSEWDYRVKRGSCLVCVGDSGEPPSEFGGRLLGGVGLVVSCPGCVANPNPEFDRICLNGEPRFARWVSSVSDAVVSEKWVLWGRRFDDGKTEPWSSPHLVKLLQLIRLVIFVSSYVFILGRGNEGAIRLLSYHELEDQIEN